MTISLSKSETPLHATEQDRKKTVEKERNGTLSRHENISTQPLKLITRNL